MASAQPYLTTLRNFLATASTWSALQTFSAGLTVSAGTITFDTVPQTSLGGSTTNVGYGTSALNALTTGTSNTAIGVAALSGNTIGTHNVGVGNGTLQSNTAGSYNIAIGSGALANYNRTTAANTYLVCVGYSAGSNYSGTESNNVILGPNIFGVGGETNTLRIGNGNTTLLLGVMTGSTISDYLSIAGMIATANGGTAPTAVTVPASGTAYMPSTTVNYILTVSGGTVTAIAINGVSTGLTSGTFYLKKSDNITFTYTVAPTVYQMTA